MKTIVPSAARLASAARLLPIPVVFLCGLAGGCSDGATLADEELTGSLAQPIINGAIPAANDALAAKVVNVGGCTGTLLSSSWVLTAAHCFGSSGALSSYPVLNRGGATVQADWVLRHPAAGGAGLPPQGGMDVALVHLSSQQFGLVSTPLRAAEPTVGQSMSVYGYGFNVGSSDDAGNVGGSGGGVLRTAVLSVAVASAGDPNRMGFGPNASGQIQWQGDSGGPSFDASGALAGVQSGAGFVVAPPNLTVTSTDQIKSNRFSGWALKVMAGRPNDFNKDDNRDILWYNSSTGETQAWHMGPGSVSLGTQTIDASRDGGGAFVTAPWRPVGSNDFNQDGMTDMLWYNSSTGKIQVWYMSLMARIGRANVTSPNGTEAAIGPPYSIVSTNDFDRDGKSDIVWYNSSTGEIQIWYMNGAALRFTRSVVYANGATAFIGPPWSIVSTNDFNSDGKPDILWHNSSTGNVQVWYMNDYTRVSSQMVTSGGVAVAVGPPYRIAGSNDFDGNGTTDLLWHNSSTGEIRVWYMNGTAVTLDQAVTANGSTVYVGAPSGIVNH